MATDAINLHDISNVVDMYEEPNEYFVPVFDYSNAAPEDIPLPPAPPEPEDIGEREQQVDYLNLPGLRTLAEPSKGKTQLLVLVEQLMPQACPECGAKADQLKANGTRRQFLLDEPRGSSRVRLDLCRRSFICKACGTSKLLPLDCVAGGRRLTHRLELYIQRRSLLRPFQEVAHETGVSAKTVREIFREYVKALELEREAECPMPRVLGLNGVYINSKERAILTDPERGLVIDILPTVQAEFWEQHCVVCRAASGSRSSPLTCQQGYVRR